MGLGLGYLYFLRQTPVYKSTAQILIIKDQLKLPGIEGLEMSSSYDRTHETLIRSPLVIETAAKQPEIAALPTFSGRTNIAGAIIGGLRVSGDGGKQGDILRLEYESLSRDDCPIVLQAVVKAYQAFLGDTYKKEGQDTADLIEKARGELESQIKEIRDRYALFQKDSPLLTTGETSQNVHQVRLQRIEEVRSEAALNNAQLQAQLDAIDAAVKRGGSREALNLMVRRLSQNETSGPADATPAPSTEEKIFPLMLQEQELLEKNNYGADHPQVKMIRKHIELTRELLLGRPEVEPVDFCQVYLASLGEKMRLNAQTIKEMTSLFEQEQQASRDLARFQQEDENYKSEISRKERVFDAVVSRLEEINLAKDAGGNTAGIN